MKSVKTTSLEKGVSPGWFPNRNGCMVKSSGGFHIEDAAAKPCQYDTNHLIIQNHRVTHTTPNKEPKATIIPALVLHLLGGMTIQIEQLF